MDAAQVKRALISVSDKTGLVEFAQGLAAAGVTIYSTGGTRSHLEAAGLSVEDVSSYTQFPEMMDGRLKTLHPKIFGGILGRLDQDHDRQSMETFGIVPFELVVVNLYPFEATVARPDVTIAEAVEKIDIGGPSLVRAAAKNHRFVAIATSPDQYAEILGDLQSTGSVSPHLRQRLMLAAFQHTAHYDQVIAEHFATLEGYGLAESHDDATTDRLPATLTVELTRQASLRYGENPHQRAALYRYGDGGSAAKSGTLVAAQQLNGKELSYNNLLDLDAAFGIARMLPDAGAVVIKHNNPCGAASGKALSEATQLAFEGDPVSAFGSVLAFNQPVDVATAKYLASPGLFVEAIVAPGFEDEAVKILTTEPKWRNNVRLLDLGSPQTDLTAWQMRCIDGGILVQEGDMLDDPQDTWDVATSIPVPDELWDELRFGWIVCRHVKSNAITVSKQRALRGAGAGQMSRVDSVEIALRKAGEHARGGILASDAFFPFPDSVERAAEAGIVGLIQPGGSKNDAAVIEACHRFQIPMVFTHRRHFKH